MMHPHQGPVPGQGQGFAHGHADDQRADEARALGHGQAVDLLPDTPAWSRAASITGRMLSRCRRAASSGTTPP